MLGIISMMVILFSVSFFVGLALMIYWVYREEKQKTYTCSTCGKNIPWKDIFKERAVLRVVNFGQDDERIEALCHKHAMGTIND